MKRRPPCWEIGHEGVPIYGHGPLARRGVELVRLNPDTSLPKPSRLHQRPQHRTDGPVPVHQPAARWQRTPLILGYRRPSPPPRSGPPIGNADTLNLVERHQLLQIQIQRLSFRRPLQASAGRRSETVVVALSTFSTGKLLQRTWKDGAPASAG